MGIDYESIFGEDYDNPNSPDYWENFIDVSYGNETKLNNGTNLNKVKKKRETEKKVNSINDNLKELLYCYKLLEENLDDYQPDKFKDYSVIFKSDIDFMEYLRNYLYNENDKLSAKKDFVEQIIEKNKYRVLCVQLSKVVELGKEFFDENTLDGKFFVREISKLDLSDLDKAWKVFEEKVQEWNNSIVSVIGLDKFKVLLEFYIIILKVQKLIRNDGWNSNSKHEKINELFNVINDNIETLIHVTYIEHLVVDYNLPF